MIRGGHLDVTVLGAFEVSERGDLANWRTGDQDIIPGVGGAMDLAVGAKEVFVIMRHLAKDGTKRMRRRCTLPVTAEQAVTRIYTEWCVAEPKGSYFEVIELAPDTTRDDVVGVIEAEVTFSMS
jgi:3-oxoadipate CoA-transferase, beta subunit